MARILILAESGFGKTSSLGEIPEIKHKGLDPSETLLISCTNKGLPFKGWKTKYTKLKVDPVTKIVSGNLLVSNQADKIIKVIEIFLKTRPDIKNYVIDDVNYIMQDYYMVNSKKKGYDVFKDIGFDLSEIFRVSDLIDNDDKNFIMMGHYEAINESGVDKYKLKSVGNMVHQYVTPEGKFEIVLVGKSSFDSGTQTAKKEFVTNYDGVYNAKSPFGMFDSLSIPNDLGYVLDKVKEYEN